MRENTNTMNLILNIAKSDPRIRVAFQTGSRVNPMEKRDEVQDYDIIFGVSSVEDFSVDQSFLEGLDTIFVYSPEISKKEINKLKHEINYKVILDNGPKIDFKFLPIESVTDLINSNTLLSLIMDKDNLIKSLSMSSDASYRTLRPTKNEFEDAVHEFFLNIIEVLPYLYRGQMTGASLAYRPVQDSLLRILSWYLGYSKDYKINFGNRYKNIYSYLDEDQKSIYKASMSFTDIESLWKSVFAALSYYRKLGLGLAERLNFDYPKEMDVKLVQYVRNVYEKSRRKLNRQLI